MSRLASVLVVAITLAACASDRERHEPAHKDPADLSEPVREAALVLPAYPLDEDLLEFKVGPARAHRYFVDAKSILLASDGTVRYSVVIRTGGGAVNVLYEGLRCASREKRIYAIGQDDRRWIEARNAQWAGIRINDQNEYQAALLREVFCPGGIIARNREQVIDALRSGPRETQY